MIKLVLDDLEISVKEDNPIYKTLKRFDGEVFTVRLGETPEAPTEEIIPSPSVETFAIESEPYYALLNESFPKGFLSTPTGSILASHLDNVFTSGRVQLVKVGNDRQDNTIFATQDSSFALVGL